MRVSAVRTLWVTTVSLCELFTLWARNLMIRVIARYAAVAVRLA